MLEVCVNSILDQVVSLSILTIAHVPRSCQPLLGQILRVKLQQANNKGIWGVMHLLMFAKVTLRQPPYNKKKQRYSNLKKWRDEGVASVWKEII